MKKVVLGRTGIEVSQLGIGTGTAHPSGRCTQALMEPDDLVNLLLYAFGRGVNFWDTACTYETHRQVGRALREINRSDVVISTKFNTNGFEDTESLFYETLSELGVDYVDICLVHGVRTDREMESRRGVLDALLELKHQGKVRAVGISSHGISALRAASVMPDIDIVLGRINYAGYCMDSLSPGVYDRIASVSWFKTLVKKMIPRHLIASLVAEHGCDRAGIEDQKEARSLMEKIHAQQKGLVGMKVLGQGRLSGDLNKAIEYVKSLSYIDSFIVGMMTREEVDGICDILG